MCICDGTGVLYPKIPALNRNARIEVSPVTYSELYGTIKNICDEITSDKVHQFYPDGSITEGSALS